MKNYPVFRESIQIFYEEGHGFAVYFYMLIILAPVEFLSLAIPALDVQMWTGSANLFKVSSVATLLLAVYFALRVANQEFASWRFQPMKHWLREQGLPSFSVGVAQLLFLTIHSFVSLLVCMPLLVWAGAIARAQPLSIVATLLLLFFYALSYGVWGLVTLAWWERKVENRQVLVRCFFFFTAIFSALLYLPLNPAAYLLAYLEGEALMPLSLLGWKFSATPVHFSFHLLLLFLGVALYYRGLKRGASL